MKQTIKHSYCADVSDAVALWKKCKVDKAEFHFSCGGDSMNDTNLYFLNAKGNKLKIDDNHPLYVYFDKVVYDNVDFYEASDGHYIGESGIVYIELDEVEGEETEFVFNKISKSEFTENFTETARIKLTKKQLAFIKKYVRNVNGNYDEEANVVFNGDILLSDEDEKILGELETLIDKEVIDYQFEQEIDTPYHGYSSDWYSYTTNIDNKELIIEGNYLLVDVTREFIVYKDDTDW